MRFVGIFVLLVGTLVCMSPHVRAEDPPFGLYVSGEKELIPLPLASTRVRGRVMGFVSRVHVTQVYVNPYDAVIEATYVFPLPERAAVTSMVMHLSDRDVKAEIKPREEAERIYEKAVSAGRTAALMTQERPNIFTQKVGNIPAGDRIEVELTYVDLLPYESGISTFAFPTVVGPRYIPGKPLAGEDQEPCARCSDTDRVTDASRISPPVLGPGDTSAHRIDLELVVAPGMPIADLASPSHEILTERRASDMAVVRLAQADSVPNKDFVLRIDLRGKRPKVGVLVHKEPGRDGYLSLVIQPPALPGPDEIAPKDLLFVVDNSGSMSGKPIEACKELVRRALADMNPDDRFTIMRFSDSVSELSAAPLKNTPENVEQGLRFIDAMAGMGGTNMLSGIRRALAGKPEPGRVRIVFFLTDGYIGNEHEILRAVQEENEAGARLFSLGVGSSVNRYLLASMARLGRGTVEVMRYDEDPSPFVSAFYRRVRNPVLTDVSVDWGGLAVEQQTPEVIPDLFDNQPLTVHARYHSPGSAWLTIRGFLGRRPFSHRVPVDLPERADRPAVAAIWARARIAGWMDEETRRPGSRKAEITELAVAHSLMSKYTAFVAVDHERIARQAREPLIPVAQRLPLPDGVTRRALGCLSRRFIPPGDPVISVAAPADARRVTAYFPFGLVKELRFDEQRDLWRGRFLVPAGIPDGQYAVLVVMELANGLLLHHQQFFALDSQAEEFFVDLNSDTITAGGILEIRVDAVEPAAEVYVDCPLLGWERFTLEPDDPEDKVDWSGELGVPEDAEPGRYEVLVVVRDRAGNRLEETVTIFVDSENS